MTITVTKPTITHNPLSWNIPCTFTSTDEWLNSLCKLVLKHYSNLESASNMHWHHDKYRHEHPILDLKEIEWYRLKVWVDVGSSEGHYVRLEAEHRKSGEALTLISCKVLNGLPYAIEVASFMTIEVLGQWQHSTGVVA